jgi:hypothetical protein
MSSLFNWDEVRVTLFNLAQTLAGTPRFHRVAVVHALRLARVDHHA